MEFVKYPKTNHIEGSKFTCDPSDLFRTHLDSVKGKHLVIEEKMDGTQVGIFFEHKYRHRIQSRGHFVDETNKPEFDLLKSWVALHNSKLWDVLGARYILFGEWLYAKHTIYYDQLPDYFMEYDIFDRHLNTFLSTDRRQELLKPLSFILSVKVVGQGVYSRAIELSELSGHSHFISTNQRENFLIELERSNQKSSTAIQQTDLTGMMEGLYIKHENEGKVEERYKFILGQFVAQILDQGDHWNQRAIIRNRIVENSDWVNIGNGRGERI